MLFLRVFQHLLPDALAWRLSPGTTIRSFFEGLAAAPQAIREFADLIFYDAFPPTTREVREWEKQFGLEHNPSEATARLALAAEWFSSGGQSPHYIQSVLQTAGFNVFIHEWWELPAPYDPHPYTEQPLLGDFQCAADGDPDQVMCTGFGLDNYPLEGQAQCDRSLVNDPGYIVNLDLTRRAPPPIPDDPNSWHYFLYFGGATFPDHAVVPASRRDEFQRLVLKLHPAQQWLVLLIDYDSGALGVFDNTFDETFG